MDSEKVVLLVAGRSRGVGVEALKTAARWDLGGGVIYRADRLHAFRPALPPRGSQRPIMNPSSTHPPLRLTASCALWWSWGTEMTLRGQAARSMSPVSAAHGDSKSRNSRV